MERQIKQTFNNVVHISPANLARRVDPIMRILPCCQAIPMLTLVFTPTQIKKNNMDVPSFSWDVNSADTLECSY